MHTPARVALGLFASVLSLLAPAALAVDRVTAAKSVSGSFIQGTNVTYTIVITNNMAFAQPDNAGNEFRDPIPAGLTFVSAVASSGTANYLTTIDAVGWDGSIGAGESVTLTIVAMIGPTATGVISNQGQTFFDADNDGSNESSLLSDETSFAVLQAGIVSATKTVSGTFVPGTDVTYTIVMTNDMTVAQGDNDGPEFTDTMPDNVTAGSVSATSGTVSASDNAVLWNGTLAAGESVTMTVVGTISPVVSGTISNQGQTNFDRDGDGQNDSNQVTDDPSTEEANDPTTFTTVPAAALFTATKAVAAGSFVPGSQVTWSVVLTNNSGHALADNAGSEFADTMPPGLTLDFASSDLGILGNPSLNVLTWDGALADGQSANITIKATIDPGATIGSTISNQATIAFDADGNGTNETNGVTDDPATAEANDATSFTVLSPFGLFTTTKSVAGTFVAGTDVTYTVTLTNHTGFTQNDNFIGSNPNELTDVLPASLTLVSASASSGTAVANTSTNTVTWNGSIADESSATITIVATISPSASGTISNQATAAFDSEGNNRNDQTQLTDDPATPAADDATTFTVVSPDGLFTATKAIANGSFVPGSQVTWTVVLTNNTGLDQADNPGYEFVDTMPAGMTLDFASASPGILGNPSLNVLTWDGALANGQSANITIKATIDGSNTPGMVLANQATIAFDADGNGTNEQSGVTDDPATEEANDATSFTVVSPAGLFTTTKSVAGAFVTGSDVTYTVTLTNHTGFTQNDNTIGSNPNEFTDVLPASLTLVSASATSGTAVANTGTNTVTWNGSIADEASVTITIVATINPSATGTISNQGTVAYDSEGNNRNDQTQLTDDPSTAAADDPTAFTVQPAAGLFLAAKSVSGGSFVPGSQVTWTVVLTNNTGLAQADNPGHEFVDTMPAGMTLDFASSNTGILGNPSLNVLTWDGALANGQSANITIKATLDPGATIGSTIANQASVAFDADGNGTNDQSTVTDDPATGAANDATSFAVLSPAGLFSATKSVSGSFVQGTNVTYTVTLTNHTGYTQNDNTIGANPNEFTDVLPASLTLVSASAASGTAVANTGTNSVTWNGSIANGASATITIVATISPSASGIIANQGTAAYDSEGNNRNDQTQLTDDPSTAASNDATSFTVIQANDVTATKSVSGSFVQGTNVTYTIVITNNMNVTQPNNFQHEFTDILPSALTYVSASATSGTAGFCCGNTFFWDGSIPAGGTVTITIVATISPTATGTISNQGQTIFANDGGDSNEDSHLTDDPSTAAVDDATSFTVIPYEADLALAMSYLPAVVGQHANVTYTLVVTNNGPLTATNVVVTDDRPDDATFQSVTTTLGSCTTADPVVCSIGTLANRASATISLVVKTPSSSYTSLTNSATATSDLPDPTPASASVSFPCTKSNGKPCKN